MKKSGKRTERVELKLSPEELSLLDELVSRPGWDRSKYLRALLLVFRVPELRDFLLMLTDCDILDINGYKITKSFLTTTKWNRTTEEQYENPAPPWELLQSKLEHVFRRRIDTRMAQGQLAQLGIMNVFPKDEALKKEEIQEAEQQELKELKELKE